jgi:hypothetical protein
MVRNLVGEVDISRSAGTGDLHRRAHSLGARLTSLLPGESELSHVPAYGLWAGLRFSFDRAEHVEVGSRRPVRYQHCDFIVESYALKPRA